MTSLLKTGLASRGDHAFVRRAVLAAGAAVCVLLLSLLLAGEVLAQAPRNPFAVGGSEGAGGAPASGIAGWLLAKQAEFYRAMTGAVRAARADGTAIWGLLLLGLGYGVFHAAGPGHGKAIIAAYVVANERALWRGIGIAFAAAALQGLVAVAVVAGVVLLAGGTRSGINSAVITIETLGFAAIALMGAVLLWRKGRALLALLRRQPVSLSAAAGCDHVHMPGPDEVLRWRWRDAAAAVLAAGLRPCSGALLILVFTLSQGVLWAGVGAVGAMSFGTALTTSAIAALAVFGKGLAVRLAAGQGRGGEIAARALEVLAAALVLALGLALLTGYLASTGA
jgi:ABC-type nickel/cobalt efflux system permease component RcnA